MKSRKLTIKNSRRNIKKKPLKKGDKATIKKTNPFKKYPHKEEYIWIWGQHAVLEAIKNPKRIFKAIYATKKYEGTLPERGSSCLEILLPSEIDKLLTKNSYHHPIAHQGILALVRPLKSESIATLLEDVRGITIMLDQITDPQNIGAIFRSACAFRARAIIMQTKNSASLSGAAAKTAVGTLEKIPYIEVVNLSRTLTALGKSGYQIIGLSEKADILVSESLYDLPTILVLGAEGKGIRTNLQTKCDQLVRIPMEQSLDSLNVSVSAAIVLYEARQRIKTL